MASLVFVHLFVHQTELHSSAGDIHRIADRLRDGSGNSAAEKFAGNVELKAARVVRIDLTEKRGKTHEERGFQLFEHVKVDP